MKTQAEIWLALLDGKTIVRTGFAHRFKLIDGMIHRCVDSSNRWEQVECSFDYPMLWKIGSEWYERDISQGVLCRVRDSLDGKWGADIIFKYDETAIFEFKGNRSAYAYAEPLDLTKPLMEQLE